MTPEGSRTTADAPNTGSTRPSARLWLPINSRLAAVGLAALIVLFTFALDFFLLRYERWKPLAMAAISDVIIGVVALILLLELLRYGRERRRQVEQRLEVIDEMNHHIRNALQVISFNARPAPGNEDQLAEITQAVQRIHWTLREILPRVEPEFAPFEGSASQKTEPKQSHE